MDSLKKIQKINDLDELNKMKVWFFKENVRLQTLENELKNKEDELSEMQEQFRREASETKRRLDMERKRLKKDEEFLRKNWTSLKTALHSLISNGRKSKTRESALRRSAAPISATAGMKGAQIWRSFYSRGSTA